MADWEEVKLGQIVEILSSKRVFASDYTTEGVPFWRGKEVVELSGGRQISTELFISEDTYQSLGRKIGFPKAGDILLTSVGTLGRAYMLTNADRIYFKDGNLTWFRNYSKRLDPTWLLYWMRSEVGQNSFERTKIGSTQPALTIINLKSLTVSLPPLSEQRAIAATLGALDDKIELNRKMSATLEAMARALFRDWFKDFGPTRAKMEGRAPYLSPDLWSLFPRRLNENGIPEGWEMRTLGELVNLTIGRTPPRKEKEHFLAGGEGIPWLSIKTMGDLQTFAYESEESLTPVAVRKFRIPLVKKGTVLVSFKLTVGRVAIAAQDMTTNEAIAHLQPNGSRSVPDEFLYCAMKEFDFKRLGSTSSIATAVNSKMLRGLPLVVPEHAMLEAFSSTTEPLFRRIEANNRESRTLARIRDLLLPRLMSGELRVNDAEEQIEEVL